MLILIENEFTVLNCSRADAEISLTTRYRLQIITLYIVDTIYNKTALIGTRQWRRVGHTPRASCREGTPKEHRGYFLRHEIYQIL